MIWKKNLHERIENKKKTLQNLDSIYINKYI